MISSSLLKTLKDSCSNGICITMRNFHQFEKAWPDFQLSITIEVDSNHKLLFASCIHTFIDNQWELGVCVSSSSSSSRHLFTITCLTMQRVLHGLFAILNSNAILESGKAFDTRSEKVIHTWNGNLCSTMKAAILISACFTTGVTGYVSFTELMFCWCYLETACFFNQVR